MASLKDEDMYDFIQNTFAFNGININDETVAHEFFALLYGGYLYGEEIKSRSDLITVYSLTSEGKGTAEKMFDMMKTFISPLFVFPAIVSEAGVADCLRVTQAASGEGMSKTAVEVAYQESIEWANEPAEVNVSSISSAAQNEVFQAHYTAGLALKYGDKVDEWHYISMKKYRGVGWTDIARAEDAENVKRGNKPGTSKQIENRARTIQNQVETLRKNLGIKVD